MKGINIERQWELAMYDHAKRTYPEECCGFIFGKDGDVRIAKYTMEVKNNKKGNKKRRFEISPLNYLEAEKYAELNNLDLLGIYHSHPNHPAVPSEHDRIQAVEFFSYIIISVFDKKIADMKSWRLNSKDLFESEQILTNQSVNKV
jgi:proteasome lid subunit RPN8/RPN11